MGRPNPTATKGTTPPHRTRAAHYNEGGPPNYKRPQEGTHMTTAIKNLKAKTKTATYKIANDPDTLLTVTITKNNGYEKRATSDNYKRDDKYDMSFKIEQENKTVHKTQPLRYNKPYQDLFVAIQNAYEGNEQVRSLTENQDWNKLTQELYKAADPDAVKREREAVNKRIAEMQEQLKMLTDHLNRLDGANTDKPEDEAPFWDDDDLDDTDW